MIISRGGKLDRQELTGQKSEEITVYKVVFAHWLTKKNILTRQLPSFPIKGAIVSVGFDVYTVQVVEWKFADELEIWIWLQ